MNNKDMVIALLLGNGWVENGLTQRTSYRTASFAYGGGSVVSLGGRVRLQRGDYKVTIGERTTCFYRKPENPETIAGAGRLAGKRVYTFRDWEQTNIRTKDIEQIKKFIVGLETAGALIE